MNELLSKLEQEMESIWDEAYGENALHKFENICEMYVKLETYWSNHFNDTAFWFEGYNIICEGLGDAYFMFNTDGPEQNDVIYRLLELVESNPNEKIVKTMINEIRENKIAEDF